MSAVLQSDWALVHANVWWEEKNAKKISDVNQKDIKIETILYSEISGILPFSNVEAKEHKNNITWELQKKILTLTKKINLDITKFIY